MTQRIKFHPNRKRIVKEALLASTILLPLTFGGCGSQGLQGSQGPQGETGAGSNIIPPTLDNTECIGGTGTFSGTCAGPDGESILLECIDVYVNEDPFDYQSSGLTCFNNAWSVSVSATSNPVFETGNAIMCYVMDEDHGIISPFETLLCE